VRLLVSCSNSYGQLGAASAEAYVPYPISCFALKNKHIVDVAAGFAHTLYLTSDGVVYAAGSNELST